MISKKNAKKITQEAEEKVYTTFKDIDSLITLHASLGMEEMEVFFTKKSAIKLVEKLHKQKYYARITEFRSLPDFCRLHVSWRSEI